VFLDSGVDLEIPVSARGETAAGPVLELRSVAVHVGGRRLWQGVDLSAGPGEFLAVLGPNGVGKSTLLKVLLGLMPAAAGTVQVLGREPGRAGQGIGYLPQRRSFDAGTRIRGIDLVRLGLDGHRWGLPAPWRGLTAPGRTAEQRLHEVLDLVGAARYAYRPIGACSGGEQQRLLIAQALVRRPRLLLLDEPLDSLDLPNQAGIADLLARICRVEGVTVVLVVHDVNPVLRHVDRVVYMSAHGVATGTPVEVITSSTLSRLYGTAVEVLTASDGRLVVVGQPERASPGTGPTAAGR
jgi:zinc/manganese transport system ATP-binding protein